MDAREGALVQDAALPWPTLTKREMQVAWCIRLGYSNEQIARDLKISISTVKKHIHNLLVKFRVHSRWELRAMLDAMSFTIPEI